MARGVMARVGLVATVALLLATPVIAADTDHDGLRDAFEKKYGVTDWLKRDTDHDGVIDSAEDNDRDRLGNLGEQRSGTDPGQKDTDGDGKSDDKEDNDRDGRSNAREQDQRPLPAAMRPKLRDAWFDRPTQRDRCLTQARGSRLKHCWFGPSDAELRIALVGDSHALMWLSPMIAAAKSQGWQLTTVMKGGCSPVKGTMNTDAYQVDRGANCQTWRKKAYAWIDAHPPDVFVLVFSDSFQLVDSRGRVYDWRNKPDVWKAGLKATLAGLPGETKAVVLGDVPRNTRSPIACLREHGKDMSACVHRREPIAKRRVEVALREAAAAKGADFRSLYRKICSYDPCPLVQGNILMWRDRHHLSDTFTTKLMPSVRDLLSDVIGSDGAST